MIGDPGGDAVAEEEIDEVLEFNTIDGEDDEDRKGGADEGVCADGDDDDEEEADVAPTIV